MNMLSSGAKPSEAKPSVDEITFMQYSAFADANFKGFVIIFSAGSAVAYVVYTLTRLQDEVIYNKATVIYNKAMIDSTLKAESEKAEARDMAVLKEAELQSLKNILLYGRSKECEAMREHEKELNQRKDEK